MLLGVVLTLAAIAIWRIGKSVFAPAPDVARGPGPGVGAHRPVPPSPPVPVLPARAAPAVPFLPHAAPVAPFQAHPAPVLPVRPDGTPPTVTPLPSWAVQGGHEPVVRFAQPPARLARGSTSPPVNDTPAIARPIVRPAAPTPPTSPAARLPDPLAPPGRRRQGLYHVSRPAHGLDEVPRRRKP